MDSVLAIWRERRWVIEKGKCLEPQMVIQMVVELVQESLLRELSWVNQA